MSLVVVSNRPKSSSINKYFRQFFDLGSSIVKSNFLILEPAVMRHTGQTHCRLANGLGLDCTFESGAWYKCVNELTVEGFSYAP